LLFAQLAGSQPPEFEAKLVKKGDQTIKVGNELESKQVLTDLDGAKFVVSSVAIKERKRNAAPPFITSKLQQTARYPVKRTMQIAQGLYEGVELPGLGVEGPIGLMTYMRTDSTRVSEDALTAVREHIGTAYGAEYVPEKPNVFKTKSDAQDAHEAIRPTSMEYDPEKVRPFLTSEQYSLYRLIWNRFVASQMPPATFDETTVDISAGDYLFRVKGTVPKFPGWLAAYGQVTEEKPETEKEKDEDDSPTGVLPPLAEGDRLELRALRPEQKFTQPPPRFTEATLVKELEENGIGRPSTYASIIGVLQDRDYANKVEGKFKPTALGLIITDLLIKSFDDILDVEYTRGLEEDLDRIEEGKADYKGTLTTFYKKFKKDLAKAGKEMQNLKEGIKTEEICDRCGKGMVIKVGKFGPFVACSGYPECTNTRELEKSEPNADVDTTQDETCENCGKPMVVKRGRFGQFLACTGYPDCKTTRKIISSGGSMKAAKPDQILDEKCPKCESNLVIKQGRFGEFTACTNYPTCKYVKLKSTGVICPTDGGDIVERKSRRGKAFYGCANYPDCEFTLWKRPIAEACPDCGTPFLLEKITKKAGRQLVCSKDDCSFVKDAPLAEPIPA
jgi:DNA topoisomerase-1